MKELKTLKEKQELDKIGKELREKQKQGETITLKTLKDLNLISKNRNNERVFTKELKAEAIKWVKEDRDSIKAEKEMPKSIKILLNYLTNKWMKRLDITEEDLK